MQLIVDLCIPIYKLRFDDCVEQEHCLLLAEADRRADLYDLSQRIRALNEEMAKEPPVPEEGLSQSSVKFKDTLVDFISPTPEPEPDSEEEPGTSPSTPQSSLVEQQPRESDSSYPASTLSEDGTSTSMKSETADDSGQQDQTQMDDGSQNPPTLPSGFPSEAMPTESSQKLNSPECEARSDGEKSPGTDTQPDAETNAANTDTSSRILNAETAKPDAETTDEACSSPDNKATEENGISDRNRAVSVHKTMLATKVVASFGKPTGNPRPKSAQSKKSLKTTIPTDAETVPGNTDTPAAAPDMEMIETDAETTDQTCSSPKVTEKRLLGHGQAARNTMMAAKVVASFGKPDGTRRPKSAEVKPVGASRNVEPNQTVVNSESDDMALVECSGRFRMMSIAELTALQRRSAPDSGCWTLRSPANPRTQNPNPRLTVWRQVFLSEFYFNCNYFYFNCNFIFIVIVYTYMRDISKRFIYLMISTLRGLYCSTVMKIQLCL